MGGVNNSTNNTGSYVIGNGITTSQDNLLYVNSISARTFYGDGRNITGAVPLEYVPSGINSSTSTEFVGNDSDTSFYPINGYNGTNSINYLVTVGGLDLLASDYTISALNDGTLILPSAPPKNVRISVRAYVYGTIGTGDVNRLMGRVIVDSSPTDGQVLTWSALSARWCYQDQIGNTNFGGTVTFNSVGTHYWRVPRNARYAEVIIQSGDGGGFGGRGTPGQSGTYPVLLHPGDLLPIYITDGAGSAFVTINY